MERALRRARLAASPVLAAVVAAIVGAAAAGAVVWAVAPGHAFAQPGARIRCEVTDNGRPAAGTVRVRRGGELVAEGRSDEALRVPPGALEVEVQLDGALDRPVETRRVSAAPGALETVRVAFETGTLTVEVAADGAPAAALIELRKAGAAVGRLSAGVRAHVGVGTYEVRVRHLHGERAETVRVAPGADAVVRVTLDPGNRRDAP